MTGMPTSRAEVIAAVRQLAARSPQSRDEMLSLERESMALALHIQKRTTLHDVPEAVWHFLADADVRFKDTSYAEMRVAEIAKVLDEWASQALPALQPQLKGI